MLVCMSACSNVTGIITLCRVLLQFWKDKRRHMLVCMSACSNVTGIITDVDAVSQIAHKYGGMVVFDYAAGGNTLIVRRVYFLFAGNSTMWNY